MESTVVLSGNVSRAIDFYRKASHLYFVVGRTSPWDEEPNYPTPDEDTLIEEVLGYKSVSSVQMVIPDESGSINYKGQIWKVIKPGYEYSLFNSEVAVGNTEIQLKYSPNITIENGDKVRIDKTGLYTVASYNSSTYLLTLQEDTTNTYPEDTVVDFGAVAEGCKWVYVEGELNYDELPLESFRQVGLVSNLTKKPNLETSGLALLPADVLDGGILETVENRYPINRSIDQRELLYIILEF